MGRLIKSLKHIGNAVNGKDPKGNHLCDVLDGIAEDYQGGETGGTKLYKHTIECSGLEYTFIAILPVSSAIGFGTTVRSQAELKAFFDANGLVAFYDEGSLSPCIYDESDSCFMIYVPSNHGYAEVDDWAQQDFDEGTTDTVTPL